MIVTRLELVDFRNYESGTFDFTSGTTAILGDNGQGKTSFLEAVGVLATRLVSERTGLPVIGAGGVRRIEDVRQYLDAGASLVAVGTAGLAHPRVPERLVRAWRRHG